MRVTPLPTPRPTTTTALCAPALPPGAWGATLPRLPRPHRSAAAGVPPLDAGFFFPVSPTPTPGLRALRRLYTPLEHRPRPRGAVRRALGLWEILGGGASRTPSPLPPGQRGEGALISGPNMATGARRTFGGGRPRRPRRHRPRRTRAYRAFPRPPLRGNRLRGPKPLVGLGERLLRPAFRPRRRRGAPQPRGVEVGLLRAPREGGLAPQRPTHSAPAAGRGVPFPLPVPKVRYRPGLSRAWRLLRLQFCLAWGLPWARQRRLSNFITQLRGVTGLGFTQMCLCGVGSLVKEAGLSPAGGLGRGAWVNGRLTRNPFFQLYLGDRVALGQTGGAHPRRDLEWLAPLATAPSPAWEVDGLTRAVTIVAEPTPAGRRPLLSRPLPFLTFRMYNWKYRH